MGDKYLKKEIRNGTNSFSCHRIEILCAIIKTKQTAMKNKRALEITSKSWTSLTCFPRIEIPLISRISSPSLRRPLRSAAPPFTTRLTTTLSMSLRTVAPWWPRTDTHLQSLYRWHNKKKTLHWAKTSLKTQGEERVWIQRNATTTFISNSFPLDMGHSGWQGFILLHSLNATTLPIPSSFHRKPESKEKHMWALGQVVNDDYVLVHEDMT